MKKISLVTVPAAEGTIDLNAFFPGVKVCADPGFKVFIEWTGLRFNTAGRDLKCSLFQAEEGESDSVIEKQMHRRFTADAPFFAAVLKFLGGEGSDLLAIPEGAEEVNLVLAYVVIPGGKVVLYVEHELEPGKEEEIHLHARRPSETHWNGEEPLVLDLLLG